MPYYKNITAWYCDICDKMHEEEDAARDCCQPPNDAEKLTFCEGCYNAIYHDSEENGCWSFSEMYVTLKKEVHINDRPPWKHTPKKFPSCYRKPKYVYVRKDQTC